LKTEKLKLSELEIKELRKTLKELEGQVVTNRSASKTSGATARAAERQFNTVCRET
jgi:hypothetical protein